MYSCITLHEYNVVRPPGFSVFCLRLYVFLQLPDKHRQTMLFMAGWILISWACSTYNALHSYKDNTSTQMNVRLEVFIAYLSSGTFTILNRCHLGSQCFCILVIAHSLVARYSSQKKWNEWRLKQQIARIQRDINMKHHPKWEFWQWYCYGWKLAPPTKMDG
jgi:hypothetical protein